MSGRGALLTVTLLAVGGLTLVVMIVEGRYGGMARVLGGIALVVVGYLLRLAESLDFLPDLLTPDVDDEDAVATFLGLAALLGGALVILQPAANVVDAQYQWALALFGLLVLTLLAIHVVASFGVED